MKKQYPGYQPSPLPQPQPREASCEMGITKIVKAAKDMRVERKTQMMANAMYRGEMMADIEKKISDRRLR